MNNKIKICFVTNGHKFTAKHRLPLIRVLIKKGYNVSCIAPLGSEAYEYFNNQGFNCHSVFMSRKGMNIIHEIKSLFSISSKYREIRPHIVVHATIKPVLYGTFIAYYYNKLKEIAFDNFEVLGPHMAQVPGPDGKRGFGGKCLPKDIRAFSWRVGN